MCIAREALLVEIHGDGVARWGVVRHEGLTSVVGLAFVPEATVGDIVLIHSGQAVRVVDAESSQDLTPS